MNERATIFTVHLFVSGVFIFGACKNDEEEVPLPTASFTYELDQTNLLLVAFTSTTTNATNFNWNFGDGNTSAEEHPTHTYSEAGNY